MSHRAIAFTTAPTQLASAAGIAATQGLNVPLVGNNPTYHPALLKTPAAKALLGSKVRVTRDRGRFLESDLAPAVSVTVHPSSILRMRDREERQAARAELTADLEKIAVRLKGG